MLYSMAEAAEKLGVSRQAVYLAIKTKRLKIVERKGTTRYFIDPQELKKYAESRYSRRWLKGENGEYIYDDNHISVSEAARLYNVPKTHLYYLIYCTNLLKFERSKTSYILLKSDAQKAAQQWKMKNGKL